MREGHATESDEAFYRSHPLRIVIGYQAGDIYTTYARSIGRYITKYIPGNPTIVPTNMPGAGSLNSVNYLYNTAPKDGSTIGTFSRGIPMQPLLDDRGIRFDPLKLQWIGSPSTEVSVVFAWHTKSFKTLRDVQEKEMMVGATGSGADTMIIPFVLNSILGTKFKVIAGYSGAAEYYLAIERGELDGSSATSWVGGIKATKPEWLSEKKINVLLQLGLEGHRDLEGVPLALDLAKDDESRKILLLVLSRQAMAYPYAAPPEIPDSRLRILRQAFDATMKDKDFLAEAAKQNLEVKPVTGRQIADLLKEVYATSPDLVARTRETIERGQAQAMYK